MIQNPKLGMNVTYHDGHGKHEIGRIKSLCDDPAYVFVVYHCDDNWKEYFNYTAARTAVKDLTPGWFMRPPNYNEEEFKLDISRVL